MHTQKQNIDFPFSNEKWIIIKLADYESNNLELSPAQFCDSINILSFPKEPRSNYKSVKIRKKIKNC